MPFYQNTEQLYAATRALFALIGQSSPHAADGILKARLVIRLRTSDPEGEIALDGRQPSLKSHFGHSTIHPELDIHMAADTLHRILLDELPLGKALSGGLLKVKGPILKTLPLADLFHQGRRYYPDVLRELGLTKS
jgi:hypothetical protein